MVYVSAKLVVICFLINIVCTAKTGHYEQDPQVSHFFGITEKVLDTDNESRRRERVLGQQIGTSITELVEIIVKSFNSLAEMMPLQKITNIDFEANPQLVKTVSTVLTGMYFHFTDTFHLNYMIFRSYPRRVLAKFRHVWDHGVLCSGGIFVPHHDHSQVDITQH